MEDMNVTFKCPLEWAILLRQYQIQIEQAISPCFNQTVILELNNLAMQLIEANPETFEQLKKFWGIYVEAFNILMANPKIGSYQPLGMISQEWDRIINADKLAENLVKEANENSVSFPLALLLAHVVRTETVGYAIWRQLGDIVNHFGKYGLTYTNDDIEFMGSVYTVISKGAKTKEIRSDAKAIRDSIAHGHFNLEKTAEGYKIEFNNDKYPYHQVFSKSELHRFFDMYTMLYKRQLLLMFIVELIPTLSRHFIKK